MFLRWKRDDVSRETSRWRDQRDAIGRAVEQAQAEIRKSRVNRALDRALKRWKSLMS